MASEMRLIDGVPHYDDYQDPTPDGQISWLYQEMGAAGAAGRGVEARLIAGIIERLERIARGADDGR